MHHILVPTDFSNAAYNALFFATQLYRDTKCTFHILNIINEKSLLTKKKKAGNKGRAFLDVLGTESKEGLLNTKHRIVLDTGNSKHTFKTISKKGQFLKTLGKLITDLKIDLVVMGNKGSTDAKDIFMGSTTSSVINTGLECPLLTIPKEIDYKTPKHLALVTDYKNCISAEQMSAILEIAKISGASIRIMHINKKETLDKFESSNMTTLSQYLEDVDHSFHWMPNFGSKTEAIRLFLEETGTDFLIMFNHRHSVLESIFREPVIKKITFDIELPFLVINATN